MPHLSAARTLARLVLVQSRLEARDGKGADAADDWISTLALGRHASSDNSIIGLMVDYGIEGLAVDAAAKDLPSLDKAALDRLAESLKKLSPRPALGRAVQVEQLIGQRWLIAHLKQDHDPQWRANLARMLGWEDPTNASVKILAGFDTPQSLAAKLAELDPLFDQVERAADMPYDQFEKSWPAIQSLISATPAAQLVMVGDFQDVRRLEAAAKVRLVLLAAATDVVRAGPDTLRSHPDPFGAGPFTYSGQGKTFQLSSALTDREGRPVTLKVGNPPAR